MNMLLKASCRLHKFQLAFVVSSPMSRLVTCCSNYLFFSVALSNKESGYAKLPNIAAKMFTRLGNHS